MVKKILAQCDQKNWFEQKRCSNFTTCNDCDLKDVKYTRIAIEGQIEKEKTILKDLIQQKKEAKKTKDKKEVKWIDYQMRDHTIGVMILQKALADDFGVGKFMSALQMFRVRRKLNKVLKGGLV